MKRQISSAIAIGSLFLSSLAPVTFAAENAVVSGNGTRSDNTVIRSNTSSNTVVQSNDASFSNNITSSSNTGGNVASGNTGGDVLVSTGNSTQQVAVDNKANLNFSTLDCCSSGAGGSVVVAGNGSDSDNFVKVKSDQANSIFQTNDAVFYNNVNTTSNTGNNFAKDNTGSVWGSPSQVTVLTGSSNSQVGIRNMANANVAKIEGSGSGTPALGGSMEILRNGTRSDNTVISLKDRSNSVVQDNSAYFSNDVYQKSNTGKNYASGNTGSDVLIGTGGAASATGIWNAANFNWASLDCGCATFSGLDKISGNGSDSDSKIVDKSDYSQSVFQDNYADFDNYVYAKANTGRNYAKDNTGPVGMFDPVRVLTGGTASETVVKNHSNLNQAGSGLALPNGWMLSLDWDWNGMWGS